MHVTMPTHACRGGTLYVQGDLGDVNVVGGADSGIYLGASAAYPGSVGNVTVQLTGPGSLVVATSTGEDCLGILGIACMPPQDSQLNMHASTQRFACAPCTAATNITGMSLDSGLVIYNQGTCNITVRCSFPCCGHYPFTSHFVIHDHAPVLAAQVAPSIVGQTAGDASGCEQAVIRVPRLQQYWDWADAALGVEIMSPPPLLPPPPPPPRALSTPRYPTDRHFPSYTHWCKLSDMLLATRKLALRRVRVTAAEVVNLVAPFAVAPAPAPAAAAPIAAPTPAPAPAAGLHF